MLKFPGPIPITIYPFFWILAAAIGWMNTFSLLGTSVWMIIILCSVLVHEFGHALSAVVFGQKAQIELVAFGGVTQRHGGKTKLWQDFIIILNGPLAGFALCGLSWLVLGIINQSHPDTLISYAVMVTFYVNLFWTVVNLLPIQPLDGGKLLSIVLEGLLGVRGIKIALFISIVFSTLVSLYFFATQSFLAGALFFMLTFESYRMWKNSLSYTDQDQNFILQHLYKDAERQMHEGHKKEALDTLNRIRELSKFGVLYNKASELAAHLFVEIGDIQSAYRILEPLSPKLSPDSLRLLHQLAYQKGEWNETIALGDRTYQYYPSYDVAIMNALSHSILGHVRPAIGWLQCAIREGVPNLIEVLEKREFDPIRNDPLFKQLRENKH